MYLPQYMLRLYLFLCRDFFFGLFAYLTVPIELLPITCSLVN